MLIYLFKTEEKICSSINYDVLDVLLDHPLYSYLNLTNAVKYAANILKGRWPQLEQNILQSKHAPAAVEYAQWVLHGRWNEAESFIMADPKSAWEYAFCVMKSRWIEAESYIIIHPHSAYCYSKCIMKNRWQEAENNMYFDVIVWNQYQEFLKGLEQQNASIS